MALNHRCAGLRGNSKQLRPSSAPTVTTHLRNRDNSAGANNARAFPGQQHPATSRQPGSALTALSSSRPARTQLRVVAAAAVAEKSAPAAAKAAEPVIPRGNTAGAAMVLDNVTIQAGDMDILT